MSLRGVSHEQPEANHTKTITRNFLLNSSLHSTTMKRHVTCFVEKAGFEPKTLGTKAERYDHCTTRPVTFYSLLLTLQANEYEQIGIQLQQANQLIGIKLQVYHYQYSY